MPGLGLGRRSGTPRRGGDRSKSRGRAGAELPSKASHALQADYGGYSPWSVAFRAPEKL